MAELAFGSGTTPRAALTSRPSLGSSRLASALPRPRHLFLPMENWPDDPASTYPVCEAMHIDRFTFGSIRIDGVVYEHDVVIAGERVRKRKKKASRPFRDAFGHTPLSIEEDIPWGCRRLVVGTGADGALPVMHEVKAEADRRGVTLVTVPTREAIRALRAEPKNTNAILHVTC